jgi:lipopolysaccharide transport system permease protein
MTFADTPAARDALLDLSADYSLSYRNYPAVRDIKNGSTLWPLAWTLGWLDIKLRYRGSMLGPFWLTLSTGIMVGSLGVPRPETRHPVAPTVAQPAPWD